MLSVVFPVDMIIIHVDMLAISRHLAFTDEGSNSSKINQDARRHEILHHTHLDYAAIISRVYSCARLTYVDFLVQRTRLEMCVCNGTRYCKRNS